MYATHQKTTKEQNIYKEEVDTSTISSSKEEKQIEPRAHQFEQGQSMSLNDGTFVQPKKSNSLPSLTQIDFKQKHSNQWGEARQTLNNQYTAIINKQTSAVEDFEKYLDIPDSPSLTDQIIQSSINTILGIVLPGVGRIIKNRVMGLVNESLKNSAGALVDSMVVQGNRKVQNAVQQAWSNNGSNQKNQLLKFVITQRQALEDIGQVQLAVMNQKLARLRATKEDNDEWRIADALDKTFRKSLSDAYNEQFNKITDIWFTTQVKNTGLGERPGVLQIKLANVFPRQSIRIEHGTLYGSGNVEEIRNNLGKRRLGDIQIPKVIRMDGGKMGMGLLGSPWHITVSGESSFGQNTISTPNYGHKRYFEGPQKVVGYNGQPRFGISWLAAFHLGLDNLHADDPRNNHANRSSGAHDIWNRIKNMEIGKINSWDW